MRDITIKIPGGFGDAFTYSSIIKQKYAQEYDHVFINVARTSDLNRIIYNDTPNVSPGWGAGDTIELTWHDCINHWDSWRNLDWNRQLDKEQECYNYFTNIYGKDYVLIHWRGKNNGGQHMNPMNLEYIENKDLPYINLDVDWLKQQGHPIHGITDYRMLIENAKEIHAYEGNYSCMIAGLQTVKHIPFYLHLYCKNELFAWGDHRSNVLRFIKENKWMKDNVNVKYVYNYSYPNGLEFDFNQIKNKLI